MPRAKKASATSSSAPRRGQRARRQKTIETGDARSCYQLTTYRGVFIMITTATGIVKAAPRLR